MRLKHLFGQVKTVAGEDAGYDVEVICSTDAVDRADEVIDQSGWELAAFQANPVLLAGHMHRLGDGSSPVIGSFVEIGVQESAGRKTLVGRIRFAATPLGEQYRSLYRDRHMRAVSVGFLPLPGGQRTETRNGKKTVVLGHNELLEVSAVAVPCNSEALARMIAAGVPLPAGSRGRAADGDGRWYAETIGELATALAEALAGPLAAKLAEAMREGDGDQAEEQRAWLLEQFDGIRSLIGDDLPADDDLDVGDADDAAGDQTRSQQEELRQRLAQMAGRLAGQ